MASPAELQAQLQATNQALAVLRARLEQGNLSPQQEAQVRNAVGILINQQTQILIEQQSLTQTNNPPDPQLPDTSTSSVPLTQIEIQPQPVVAVDVTPPLPGISGPIDGISPYGEQDEPFDPNLVSQPEPALFTEEYVQNQDNPVELPQDQDTGFSPYGEENEPLDPVPLVDPFEVDSIGYGSAETEFEQDNPNLVTLVAPDPYEIDGAGIGLTEEEIQEQDNPIAARQSDTLNRARAQAILQQQRKQANDGDWRVRLRLAPSAQYLYKSDSPGILQPLAVTDGVVFPYTPRITTAYKASYNSYNLTHSNYRGFFYQGSQVDDIQIDAIFTAQDTAEANYLLAVIHFFRSVTKMFYGANDPAAGAPPPLVFLQGLGQYQFNLAPCVVSQFNYNLPTDVDYIRAGSPNINGTNLLQRRQRQDLPTNPFTSAWSRIENVLKPQNIKKGAIPAPPAPPTLGTNSPTYVPTKMEISLILHPMQTREQVSKQFSLRQYANGDLLKGGFW